MVNSIIIFTRYPTPGKVKTRLISALGEEGAAALQRQMTIHILEIVDGYRKNANVRMEVWFDGGSKSQMERLFGAKRNYHQQGPGDLGEKLSRAIGRAFEHGDKAVVVVGSDSPEVSSQTFMNAFRALQSYDVVLGPAKDGGYYLLGLRRMWPELLKGVAWGSEIVLDQTLTAARKLGVSVKLLETLTDIDTPSDLLVWEQTSLRKSLSQKISIIVPTRNEEQCIGSTLDCALHAKNNEILVVDASSKDRTVEIAKDRGVDVYESLPGRWRQMNVGAHHASGDILLFLHADTKLPPDFDEEVRRVLTLPRVKLGAFRLSFERKDLFFRTVAWGANNRTRFFGLPYGDQALFLPAHVFQELGGFCETPLMEDVEFVTRIKHHGRIALASLAVETSSRRWLEKGKLRTCLIHQSCLAAFCLGVESQTIARWRSRIE